MMKEVWHKRQTVEGEKLIEDYYIIAPLIISKINQLSNAKEIYEFIWKQYLKKCLSLIESGKNQECKSLYEKMVKKLKETYLRM